MKLHLLQHHRTVFPKAVKRPALSAVSKCSLRINIKMCVVYISFEKCQNTNNVKKTLKVAKNDLFAVKGMGRISELLRW